MRLPDWLGTTAAFGSTLCAIGQKAAYLIIWFSLERTLGDRRKSIAVCAYSPDCNVMEDHMVVVGNATLNSVGSSSLSELESMRTRVSFRTAR